MILAERKCSRFMNKGYSCVMDHPRIAARASIAIGERVRNRRLEDGLTEEAVARALGCDIDDLRAAESGEVNFTAEDIISLCPIFRVTPSWFFEGLI